MINKLHSIFNIGFVNVVDNEIEITEREQGARVNSVKVSNATFFNFNKEILDKANDIFKNNNHSISLAKGCDGILLFKVDEIWYLFLIELKSKFSSTNINNANQQIQISFAKIAVLMSMIKDFVPLNECRKRAFIVCEEPCSEEKSRFLKISASISGYCIEKLCMKLIERLDISIHKEHSLLKDFPLNEAYCFDKMPLYYIPSTKREINVLEYL